MADVRKATQPELSDLDYVREHPERFDADIALALAAMPMTVGAPDLAAMELVRQETERYRANIAQLRALLGPSGRRALVEMLDSIVAMTKADPRHFMDCPALNRTHDTLAQVRHDLDRQ